jgi:hypothetical protein
LARFYVKVEKIFRQGKLTVQQAGKLWATGSTLVGKARKKVAVADYQNPIVAQLFYATGACKMLLSVCSKEVGCSLGCGLKITLQEASEKFSRGPCGGFRCTMALYVRKCSLQFFLQKLLLCGGTSSVNAFKNNEIL